MRVQVEVNGAKVPVPYFFKGGRVTAIKWNGARVTVRGGCVNIDGARVAIECIII